MREIADYRAGCLVILGDENGRRYSNNMIDAGFREALPVYRSFCPKKETVKQPVRAVEGSSVLIQPLPPGVDIQTARIEGGEWLEFATYQTDQWLYINLYGFPAMPAVGTQLILTLSCPYTIKDLDGATQTTVPDRHAGTLITGAAGYAMRIRARSITEVFGKRPEDREAIMNEAEQLINQYFAELAALQPASRDPLPRGGFPI